MSNLPICSCCQLFNYLNPIPNNFNFSLHLTLRQPIQTFALVIGAKHSLEMSVSPQGTLRQLLGKCCNIICAP